VLNAHTRSQTFLLTLIRLRKHLCSDTECACRSVRRLAQEPWLHHVAGRPVTAGVGAVFFLPQTIFFALSRYRVPCWPRAPLGLPQTPRGWAPQTPQMCQKSHFLHTYGTSAPDLRTTRASTARVESREALESRACSVLLAWRPSRESSPRRHAPAFKVSHTAPHLTAMSSTVKTRVAFGGMAGGEPRSP